MAKLWKTSLVESLSKAYVPVMRNLEDHARKFLRQKRTLFALLLSLLLIAGCSGNGGSGESFGGNYSHSAGQTQQYSQGTASLENVDDDADTDENDSDDSEQATSSESSTGGSAAESGATKNTASTSGKASKSSSIKNGVPSVLKGNWSSESNGLYYTSDEDPSFSKALKGKTASFENYSALDELGRCGAALACIGLDIMPTGGRGSISEIKPTGWHTYNYDFVNGGYLYNRCHLIAYSLAGENANERNLITGTRQMNEAMIMFENIVYTYVTGTGNHCLYRVTPVFLGNELVARGVQMEAYSVEDKGKKVKFNVYLPNKQDKVSIDYLTGESALKSSSKSSKSTKSSASSKSSSSSSAKSSSSKSSAAKSSGSSSKSSTSYVLNTSSKKFHYSYCSAVSRMADKNKSVVKWSRSSIISKGYDPCGICNP